MSYRCCRHCHQVGTCLNKHLHFHAELVWFKSLDEVENSKIYGHPVRFVIIISIIENVVINKDLSLFKKRKVRD